MNLYQVSLYGGFISLVMYLAGVHSSIHGASTNHSRGQVHTVDARVGADGLSYHLDLSLP